MGKAITIHDQLVAALEARGWKQTTCASYKYTELTHPNAEGHFFVGKMGALRFGPCATKSHSHSDAYKAKLIDGTILMRFEVKK